MKTPRTIRLFGHSFPFQIENLWLKVVSLVLALLLFAVSRQPTSEVSFHGIPVEYRGLSQGIDIVTEPQSLSANIRLRGPRDMLRNLESSQLVVVADLANKELGERLIYLTADKSSLPDNTEVVGIEPPSIKLKLERTVRKTVSIEPQYVGELSEGSELYGFRLAPSTVEIEGPQSLVDKTNMLYTESITLSGRQQNFTTSVAVEPPNSFIRVKSNASVSISLEIGERRMSRQFPAVPVIWLDRPAGWRLLTPTVSVEAYGPASMLQSLRTEDLSAEIRTTDFPDGAESAAPRIKLPAETNTHIILRNIFPKGVKVKRP